jgi:predicted aldo/keto reductase-like oxidoreductase
MALNAGLARMADVPGGFKATLMGAGSFERLALPVATRKKMGVIAMKVFGQEQLLGAAPAEKLLTYALSLPISLASLGMPRLEHIESNVAVARAFRPMSTRQRQQLEESIESGRKLALHQFFAAHQDV